MPSGESITRHFHIELFPQEIDLVPVGRGFCQYPNKTKCTNTRFMEGRNIKKV